MLQCDYHFILDDINVYGSGVSINAIWYTISLFDMLHNFIKLTQKQFVHFYWLFAIIIFALFFSPATVVVVAVVVVSFDDSFSDGLQRDD